MTLAPGDDVFVDFENGEDELAGHIDKIERGWVRCTVQIDVESDYGRGTERLSPYQTVMVPVARVRPRE